MNSDGSSLSSSGYSGLLLADDGTVCDDLFSDNSAAAICREMGFSGATSWTSGYKWSIQSSYNIKLDNVKCSSTYWSSCRYYYGSSSHDCRHVEDVFLTCYRGKLPLVMRFYSNQF